METTLRGASGATYSFTVCGLEQEFDDALAVYVFARSASTGYAPVYIGRTFHLRSRIAQHRKQDGKYGCALKNGADHILVHYVAPGDILVDAEAKMVEKDLIDAYETPCNMK